MQSVPLMISGILRHAEVGHPEREIVSRTVDGGVWRYDYAGFAERVRRCGNMLRNAGVSPGDLVTSLAWNTHRHMELFFVVPGIGAVLHTANPRLSDDQLAYTINHAGSRVLFHDPNLAGLVDRLRPKLAAVETFVSLDNADPKSDGSDECSYERLLAEASPRLEWPLFDENEAAFLCYTSGTTGHPKGVLYSHRSVILHALTAGLSSALGVDAFDCIMPCQSLYHATAWGLPFVAAINGCKLVLPADRFDGAGLHELIRDEGVTLSGGVPTIWTMYLDHLQRAAEDTGSLSRIVIGGSAVPRAMAETFEARYGVQVRQIWGMTETSPLGVLSTPTPKLAAAGPSALENTIWTRQGRRQFGVELKIVDEEGRELPSDGQSAGPVLVRGPWVIERYFRSDQTALDGEGWFITGDIATVDEYGFMRITDRAKDVIKSGGEWISTIDIENAATAYSGVKFAAVVGIFHPKWEERPILIVEAYEGAELTREVMLAHLEQHMPRWWLPDSVIFAAIPMSATGKIDNKGLRERYAHHLASASSVA